MQNLNESHIWHNFVLFLVKIYFLAFFIFLSIGLFIKLNLKLYCKKVKIKRKKTMPNYFSKNKISLTTQIISISICKLVLAYIIYLALKTKPELKTVRHKEKRLNYKAYFLSPEYFKDIYKIDENRMRHLLKWHCLSKLKLTSFKSFYQTLVLLSGDIALNPGPISYPCSKCSKGVRVGVLCMHCKLWIHKNCEGLSSSEITKLSKSETDKSNFTCTVCRESMKALPFSNEADLPQNEISFEFQEEHLQNISLDDPTTAFKMKSLHFMHLNCNSLLSKIDEIREFVKSAKPHVLCFSETKLDHSVKDAEVNIDDFSCLRKDRNRSGGGVAIFVHKSLAYDQRSDFNGNFENIFIDILLPKTKPILVGVVYRPPKSSGFVEIFTESIINSNSFETQEAYILGDININLLDKKNKLVHKKGYRFSKEETSYCSGLCLTRKYTQFLSTFGLSQLIEEPTRKTDRTKSLIDHILVNTSDKISQAGVIGMAISDHDIIYCTRKHQKYKTGQHNPIKIRSMKNYSKEVLVKKLGKISFPDYNAFECVNTAYQDFISKIMDVIDIIAPLKEIRIKGNSKSWFDCEILERISIREKLRKKHKKSGLQIDSETIKNAQKQAQQMMKAKNVITSRNN